MKQAFVILVPMACVGLAYFSGMARDYVLEKG
jgi:hypothetical protein